jgi:hypothetical protein
MSMRKILKSGIEEIHLSRRQFLAYTCISAAVPTIYKTAIARPATNFQLEGSQPFSNSESMMRIGDWITKNLNSNEKQNILDLAAKRQLITQTISFANIKTNISNDYLNDRTITIKGFQLSITEVVVCIQYTAMS